MSDPMPYISPRSFIRNTLLIMLYLLTLAVPQWMLLSIFNTLDNTNYTLICFFSSLLLLTLIHLVEIFKYQWPCNWLAIGCCYELMTFGMGTFVMNRNLNTIMMAISMAFLVYGFVLVLCFFIIVGYNYPNPYKMAALAGIGFVIIVGVVTAGTLYYWTNWLDWALAIFILSVLIMMISYVLISFKNLDILIGGDALVLGFVLYMNYVLLLVACFICIQRYDYDFLTKTGQKASPLQ